jgi:hypothetical protein
VRLWNWLRGCDYDTLTCLVAGALAMGTIVAALIMLAWR